MASLPAIITPASSQPPIWCAPVTGSADYGPIRAIHRGPDGYVTLHRKVAQDGETKWVDIGAVEARELASKFSEIHSQLAQDSYFSINSFYRAAPWRLPTGLAAPARNSNTIRWLNAAYVDLDCRVIGLSSGAVLAKVIAMVDNGELVRPSVVVHSGRGMWLLWLLADGNDRSIPQPAWPEKVGLYSRIQHAIVQRLQSFGADLACVDVSRVMRVPGSINSKAPVGSQHVVFQQMLTPSGEHIVYTLLEMAAAFGVTAQRAANWTSDRPDVCLPARAPKAHKGCTGNAGLHARWQNALLDFEHLRLMRGGFRKDYRTHAVLLYSFLLTRNGVTGSDRQRAVLQLAGQCQPPLETNKALRTIQDGSNLKWPIRHTTLAAKLGVTEEERTHLTHWFPATMPTCRERIDQRYALILRLVESLGLVPPHRQMAKLLADNGCDITARQIGYDYCKLHLTSCYIHEQSKESSTDAKSLASAKAPHSLSALAH